VKALRPVYIDRIGHVSALGLSAAAAAEAFLADKKTVSWRELPEARYPWFALPLPETDWTARTLRALDFINAELASGLPPSPFSGLPLFAGSSALATGAAEARTRASGAPAVDFDDLADFRNKVCAAFSIETEPYLYSTSCTSGFAALEAAALLIGHGEIDEALVLGVEFGCDTTLAGFASLGLLARDESSEGLILGEAVAGLRLTAQAATWRIAACRLGTDGYSVTSPTPDGRVIASNIAAALDDAGLSASDIDLIKPHRSRMFSTDEPEEAALELLFGSRRPPEITFKRRLGHTLGASGPAELSILLALLDMRCAQARYGQPRRLLFNLVGFGGSTATLIVERCQETGGKN
jgi:3-oxoacyl-[acyl-carrier-protein] synthase-1